ncbi:MAG: DMT family transporter [Nibricoccus sp.]
MPPRSKHPQHFRAVAMLLLANLFWGLSFPTIKALALLHEKVLPGSSSGFVTAMLVTPRYIVGALVMLIWQGRRLGATSKLEVRQGFELGLFTTLGVLLQNDGLQHTQASTSAFLTQLYAVLIPAWVGLRQRRNPGVRVWISGGLVLIGVAILGRFDWRTFSLGRGEWVTLLGSFFFAGQILCLERKEFAGNDALRVTTVMFVTQAAMFSDFSMFIVPNVTSMARLWTSVPWLGGTLMLAGVCTVAAINIMNRWQPKITAIEAGLIYCVEPIFGALFALVLPAWYSRWSGIEYANETATLSLLIGGGLITAANILINLRPTGLHK